MHKAIKNMLLGGLETAIALLVIIITATTASAAPAPMTNGAESSYTTASDSIIDRRRHEMDDLSSHMIQSAYPVQINLMGSAIRVKSNYNQVLPVYTESGQFYAAFRLNKGSNWLSGLPRGTYYINNRKITIP